MEKVVFIGEVPYEAVQRGIVSIAELLWMSDVNMRAERDINSITIEDRTKRKDIIKRINAMDI